MSDGVGIGILGLIEGGVCVLCMYGVLGEMATGCVQLIVCFGGRVWCWGIEMSLVRGTDAMTYQTNGCGTEATARCRKGLQDTVVYPNM